MVTPETSPTNQHAQAAVRLLRRLTSEELKQVVTLMPELRSLTTNETELPIADYWRQVLKEEGPGYQPALDDEFVDGLTYRAYFALSVAEQYAVWDTLFAEDARAIETVEETDVRPNPDLVTRQEYRAERASRARAARTRTTLNTPDHWPLEILRAVRAHQVRGVISPELEHILQHRLLPPLARLALGGVGCFSAYALLQALGQTFARGRFYA